MLVRSSMQSPLTAMDIVSNRKHIGQLCILHTSMVRLPSHGTEARLTKCRNGLPTSLDSCDISAIVLQTLLGQRRANINIGEGGQ